MAKTVLIVDDIEFVRKTLASIVTQAHYDVVGEACDGAEAVKLFEKLKPDLVTMDVVMPQMSGVEAIRRIIKIDNKAKVIIVSAMADESLIMEGINAGARDYISKPFSSSDIIKAIERVLNADHGPNVRPVQRMG